MTTATPKKAREMPKGGKKGGTMFPRVPLAEALIYAKKLVSKTHTGPQTQEVILLGVLGSKHAKGQLGMSALKQYGLMKGDIKSNFTADSLAKQIAAAPDEELAPLHRQAVLKPTVFKALFETFHGDTISKAKLMQRAADVKVHPDETANCVDIYISGMLTAGLVTVAGDQVTHLASSDLALLSASNRVPGIDAEAADKRHSGDETNGDSPGTDNEVSVPGSGSTEANAESTGLPNGLGGTGPRAVFNVNVTLDSSLDTEKLLKQLELLKRFGAI